MTQKSDMKIANTLNLSNSKTGATRAILVSDGAEDRGTNQLLGQDLELIQHEWLLFNNLDQSKILYTIVHKMEDPQNSTSIYTSNGPHCFGLGIGKPFGFLRNSFRCYMGDFRRIFTCKSCRMGRSYQEVLHRFINNKRKGLLFIRMLG